MIADVVRFVLVASGLALVALLVWWLLIASEGVYLGRRMVILLYDLYAKHYDGVKSYVREYEEAYLAKPLMQQIRPQTNPLVLDVATGTGRLPLALARHDSFTGHTIGVDLSSKMLAQAPQNLYPHDHRAAFVLAPAEHLPFADNSFDVVTCLEALEFMVSPRATLIELVRVLRPAGLLLVTQRINTRWMPGKVWTKERFQAELAAAGVVGVTIQGWETDYRKVWGRKSGHAAPIGIPN